VYGQSGVLVSKSHLLDVRTPEELGRWMNAYLTYQAEPTGEDVWKTSEQTLQDRGGDCEDLAILVQRVLEDLQIESQLIYVGLPTVGHVLCFYRTSIGKLNFFDNTSFVQTNFVTIREVLDVWYPRWLRVADITSEKEYSNWTSK
jgi:hypothetical protein